MDNDVKPRVLVTGGTGRIGRYVIDELLARGYRVRALTSRPVPTADADDQLEWRQLDFNESLEFDPLVSGCAAVLHLGAELRVVDRMQRLNVDATRALAEASERCAVKVFCYTSSVAVYGSSRRRLVSENSPVLTPDRDVRREYWGNEVLRCYGRTKLQGELAIQAAAREVEYIVLRPTVVVNIDDLRGLGDRSKAWKRVVGTRNAHHIYTPDVVDAVLWFMERGLDCDKPTPAVSVFNLSDDEAPNSRYRELFKAGYEASGDNRWNASPVPWPSVWLHAIAKNRTLLFRRPLGQMLFVGDKLRREGYKFRFGLAHAIDELCGQLAAERDAL